MKTWRGVTAKRGLVPLALLGLAIGAYGALLPSLGFYWDDWPWAWIAHVAGPQGLRQIDAAHRPLAGELLWLSGLLAGASPLRWQALNLVYRWLGALALWWALGKLWPRRVGGAAWVAFLFLVYPGFSQQFVSINSSRHIFPMAVFFVSLGCMLWAARERRLYYPLTGLSLLCALLAMLTTEYFYGLELLRPLMLWFVFGERGDERRARLRETLAIYAPYLLLFLGVLAWRYSVSLTENYAITLAQSLRSDPLEALLASLASAWQGVRAALFDAWGQALDFPKAQVFGPQKTIVYWGLAVGTALFSFAVLGLIGPPPGEAQRRSAMGKPAAALGLLALAVGGLPFLATGLPVRLVFPADRGLLPLTFGASLLLVGLLDVLGCAFQAGWRRAIPAGLLSLAVGLGAGWHFQNAAAYQRDWRTQADFFRQLAWRIPALEPGTALLTHDLPGSVSTDNSLTAPLNWLYLQEALTDELAADRLPYMLFDLDVRLGSRIPALEEGVAIQTAYFDTVFKGSASRALVIYAPSPGCLRVLHPQYDARYPGLPERLAAALPLANLETIRVNETRPLAALAALFGGEPFGAAVETSWCYHFQKADLARQSGDWLEVARIGDIAYSLDDSPNHASEHAPFIQGYAFTGQWERAAGLTLEAVRANRRLEPMLCAMWAEIGEQTPQGEGKRRAMQEVEQGLGCGGN